MAIQKLIKDKIAAKEAREVAKPPKYARKNQGEKYSLSLAGEFYVAAELHRHGIHASVSYGTAKNADVYAFAPSTNRYVKVEVKSASAGSLNWPTGKNSIYDELISPDTFWVFVLVPLPDDAIAPEFFVYSSEELVRALQASANAYNEGYKARHGRNFDQNKGVHGLQVARAREMGGKNAWAKIKARLSELG